MIIKQLEKLHILSFKYSFAIGVPNNRIAFPQTVEKSAIDRRKEQQNPLKSMFC